MKLTLVVQAEGKGHMTQAISAAQILAAHGHTIEHVVIGRPRDQVPSFFSDFFQNKVLFFNGFALKYTHGKLNLSLTIFHILLATPRLVLSFLKVLKHLNKADVILNFYEPTLGIFRWLIKPPVISTAHQFCFKNTDSALFNLNNTLAAVGTVLPLSFVPKPNALPPLLRQHVYAGRPRTENFVVVYFSKGFWANQLAEYCTQYPEHQVVIFGEHDLVQLPPNLVVLPFDQTVFVEKISASAGLVTTAGFETIAEAAYFHKPIVAVPMPNHFEQNLNAHDAENCRMAAAHVDFNFEVLFQKLASQPSAEVDVDWFKKAPTLLVRAIEEVYQSKSK